MPLGVNKATPVLFAYDESSTTYSVTPITGGPTLAWSNEYRLVQLYQLPDMNGNGALEYGLFGIRSDEGGEERLQLFIRDSETGNRVSVLNWVANWSQVSIVVLEDVTGDGITDIGLQGYFKEGYRPQLVVKDGLTNKSHQTYSFPNLWNGPQYTGFSDTTGDGVKDVALFGQTKRNGKFQVKVIDGTNRNNKLKAYNFPAKWTETSWHNVGDYNGDGKDEVALLGKASGNTIELVIKLSKGGYTTEETLDLGNDWQATPTISEFDTNGDGIPEWVAWGLNNSGEATVMPVTLQ